MKLLSIAVFFTLLASQSVYAADTRYDFQVEGMTCASCVVRAEKEFKQMQGVQSVNTNLDTGTVSVCANETTTFTDEQVKTFFLERGFTYKGMNKQEQC